MRQRPTTIPVVAAFLFVATAIAAIFGVSWLFQNAFLNCLWELNKPAERAFRARAKTSGLSLMLLSFGFFGSGVGMLRR